jgi:hypothetical protein
MKDWKPLNREERRHRHQWEVIVPLANGERIRLGLICAICGKPKPGPA